MGDGTGPISYDQNHEPSPPRGAGGPRKLLLVLAGVVLTFLVVTHSFVAYLADASPRTALMISSGDPVALVNFAERTMTRPKQVAITAPPTDGKAAVPERNEQGNAAQPNAKARPPRPDVNGIEAELDASELAELRERVERALAADPTSAKAIRILGQLVDQEGDAARATSLLEAAARRSKHDSVAVFLMIRRNLDTQNWAAALFYADVLMRSRYDLVQMVTPMVVRLAETPAANPLVKKLLAANPVWRPIFMQLMLSSVTDARTPLDLYLALREAGSPPARQDLAAYFNFLIGHRFQDIAYYAWLQFLPPEQMAVAGFVFNGNFELTLSGMPFDWTLPRALEATVDVAPVPGEDGNRALRIEFGSGRVQLGEVQQRLLLGAGSYRLTGRLKGEVAGRKGTRLTIACTEQNNERIAETPMFIGQQLEWRSFETSFTVQEGCRSQVLRIIHDARFSAEQFLSGLVWYDDIAIVRADGGG